MKFRPITRIPDDRLDGRPMLIQHGDKPWVRRARFWPGEPGCWIDVETGGKLLGVTGWADVRAGAEPDSPSA